MKLKVKLFYIQRELWNAPLQPFAAPFPIFNITLLHWVVKQTTTGIKKKKKSIACSYYTDIWSNRGILKFHNGDIYSICTVRTDEMFEPLAIYCSHARAGLSIRSLTVTLKVALARIYLHLLYEPLSQTTSFSSAVCFTRLMMQSCISLLGCAAVTRLTLFYSLLYRRARNTG